MCVTRETIRSPHGSERIKKYEKKKKDSKEVEAEEEMEEEKEAKRKEETESCIQITIYKHFSIMCTKVDKKRNYGAFK